MAIDIRGLATDDWQNYKESRLRALRLAPTAYTSNYDDQADYPDTFFQQRATFLPHNFIFAAWQENQIVGTAGGFIEQETKRRHIGHIVGVWVEPEFRRQGIARDLTQAAIDQLKRHPDVTIIQIAATATNTGAVTLYESMGFERYGLEPQALQHEGVFYDEVTMAMPVAR